MSDEFSPWLNRHSTASEAITPRLLAQFRATLAENLADTEVPPGLHWCLLPDLPAPADLGRDGHARPGIFVPELPLPRRMWAGGEVQFLAPLHHGDMVTRDQHFSDIMRKTGTTGPLVFLTQRSTWSVGCRVCISERRDYVYRPEAKPGQTPVPRMAEPWPMAQGFDITPDPVLLFRYSAMTFNGHRIHYDQPYATAVEGYDGLVVHGPLQAIWLMNLAARILCAPPRQFRYRGLAPLICGLTVRAEARQMPDGLALRVRKSDGEVTLEAQASP